MPSARTRNRSTRFCPWGMNSKVLEMIFYDEISGLRDYEHTDLLSLDDRDRKRS